MSAAIVGIGTWVPEPVRLNDAWPPTFGTREREPSGADRTFNDIPTSSDPVAAAILEEHLAAEAADPFLGAVRRHIAPESVTAVEAESEAVLSALADAGIRAEDVDFVLSNSMVPDRLMPSTAAAVTHRIGAERAVGLGVDSVCASALTQLTMARALIESKQAKVVVMVQSHLLLRAFPLLHPACPGLGDAACALVLTESASGLRMCGSFAVTHGQYARAVTYVRGSDDASDPPWWQRGGEYRLGTRAPEQAKLLMRETVTYGAATLREAARRAEKDVERIQVLASVQPRGFMPSAIAKRLGIDAECAVTTYREIAHVGACGPTFNLAKARRMGRLTPGTLVGLYAQGAGFTRAAAILEVA